MATIESTHERTRSEIADYLREFADELDPGRGPDSSDRAGRSDRSGRTEDAATGRGGRSSDTGPRDANARDRDATAGTGDRDATADTEDRERTAAAGDKVTVIVGNESATINPPRTCSFDVAIDTDSSLLDAGAERSATFTIRWSEEHVEADDELSVE